MSSQRSYQRPTKVALVGLVIGSAVALVAALGPLASATLITIGVETAVGEATGLPDPAMLPASLEGLGAVALAYLITIRPADGMRVWCVALIGATLAAGMAAQGSHALWFDAKTNALVLPWGVKLFVSFVPPASGAAALHLVVKMAEGLISAVRQLQALPAEPRDEPGDLVVDVDAPAANGALADGADAAREHGSELSPGSLAAPPAPGELAPAPLPAGALTSGGGDVAEPAREQGSELPAGSPEPPPDDRPTGTGRPAPKRGRRAARGHAREQAPRLPAAEVRALVESARERVLADPDRAVDKALDEAIAERLSTDGHPLSRSRVRTYLAELRRESPQFGSGPARRPRVVHLEAAPAAASAREA